MLAWPSEPGLAVEDRWSILNNNRVTHNDPALSRYHTLVDALDGGWQVEPPIYVRGDWSLKRKDNLGLSLCPATQFPAHDHAVERARLRSGAALDCRKRLGTESERSVDLREGCNLPEVFFLRNLYPHSPDA